AVRPERHGRDPRGRLRVAAGHRVAEVPGQARPSGHPAAAAARRDPRLRADHHAARRAQATSRPSGRRGRAGSRDRAGRGPGGRLTGMRELYARMAELEREGRPFAVATVVRTVGSTPQVVGAKMLVDDLGRTFGTLGGGCVEGDAFEEAKRILGEGGTSLREYELTEELAWDTGLV